jgi:hypothetical protein
LGGRVALLAKNPGFDLEAAPRYLHEGSIGGAAVSHHCRQPDKAVSTDQAHFDGGSILHGDDDRRDTLLEEVDSLDHLAGIMQGAIARKADRREMRSEALKFRCRQRSQ